MNNEKLCAILIGIRYPAGNSHLNGCHNDIKNVHNYLENEKKEQNLDIDYIVLADSKEPICGKIENIWPSRDAILKAFESSIGRYNKYFIHYSGHGTNKRDSSGDESDHLDEAICPYDFNDSGVITDDELRKRFLDRLDEKCVVRILMDCCRSGTIWDLSHIYKASIRKWIVDTYNQSKCDADVVCLSGCKDDQYSYDVYADGEAQGAFTYCALKHIRGPGIGIVLDNIQNLLNKKGWRQIATLSSCNFVGNDRKFLQW